MTLLPEDRDKIYEEEKARREAQDRLQQEEAQAKKAETRRKGKRLGLAMLAMFAFAWILSILTGSNEKKAISMPTRGANTLKSGRVACTSKALLVDLATAIAQNDARAIQHLAQSGCIITKDAIPVTVLNLELPEVAKVRAYLGNQAIELWTTFDNLQDQR